MKLFLPQATLEEWVLAEKADLKDGGLYIVESKTTHPVVAALHFRQVLSGTDAHGFLNKVKTKEQLAAVGGEHMADSAIVGDAAYQVVEGYLTEVETRSAPADPRKKGAAEADLLAAFLLDKMS